MLHFIDCNFITSNIQRYILYGEEGLDRYTPCGDGIPNPMLLHGLDGPYLEDSLVLETTRESSTISCRRPRRSMMAVAGEDDALERLYTLYVDDGYKTAVSETRKIIDEYMPRWTADDEDCRITYTSVKTKHKHEMSTSNTKLYLPLLGPRPTRPLVCADIVPYGKDAELNLLMEFSRIAKKCLKNGLAIRDNYKYTELLPLLEAYWKEAGINMSWFHTGMFESLFKLRIRLYIYKYWIVPNTTTTRALGYSLKPYRTCIICSPDELDDPVDWCDETREFMTKTSSPQIISGYAHAVSTLLQRIPEHDVVNLTGDGNCVWVSLYAVTAPLFDVGNMQATLADRLNFVANIQNSMSSVCVRDSAVHFGKGHIHSGSKTTRVPMMVNALCVANAQGTVIHDLAIHFNWLFKDEPHAVMILDVIPGKDGALLLNDNTMRNLALLEQWPSEKRLPIVILCDDEHAMGVRFKDASRRPLAFEFSQNKVNEYLSYTLLMPSRTAIPSKYTCNVYEDVALMIRSRSFVYRKQVYEDAMLWSNEVQRVSAINSPSVRLLDSFREYCTVGWPQYIQYGWDVLHFIEKHSDAVKNVPNDKVPSVYKILIEGDPALKLLCSLSVKRWCRHMIDEKLYFHDDENVRVAASSGHPITKTGFINLYNTHIYRVLGSTAWPSDIQGIDGLREFTSRLSEEIVGTALDMELDLNDFCRLIPTSAIGGSDAFAQGYGKAWTVDGKYKRYHTGVCLVAALSGSLLGWLT